MKKSVALIIVGSLASIATSQKPSTWSESDLRDLPLATIDNQRPLVRYQIRAERHGPGPFSDTYHSQVDVNVIVDSTSPVPIVTAELRSLTHPDVMPTTLSLPANEFKRYISIAAFLDCNADPCIEDFELTIQRDAAASVPAFQVKGSASSGVEGDGERPPNIEVIVSVTGPT